MSNNVYTRAIICITNPAPMDITVTIEHSIQISMTRIPAAWKVLFCHIGQYAKALPVMPSTFFVGTLP